MNRPITPRLALVMSTAAALLLGPLATYAAAPVVIGYAVSKTGPYAGGATTTTLPNYELWIEEVNEAGGLKVGDQRRPIEVVEYDDRSSSEETVRAVERLINQDEADIVLPPWGTALNLAVGPILDRNGYLHLAVTSVTDRIPDLHRRWPRSFFFLEMSRNYAEGMVDVLKDLREAGKIEGRVAMVNVADAFGIELANAARDSLEAAGFELVYDESYPPGTQDMQSVINGARRAEPEVFLAMSYPPDTLAITEQARTLGFNPDLFFTAVGTAFPIFQQRFGSAAEGVTGIGGINADSPQLQDYMERHQAATGKAPDSWASPVTYASLQVLQQAIERAGSLDHEAIAGEIRDGSFDTVIGKVNVKDGVYLDGWLVGQWQDGAFRGIAPADKEAAAELVFPKPAWQ